jgi:hypothetical protein
LPVICLDTGDAVELAELLEFVSDWLAADPDELRASLAELGPAKPVRSGQV